MLALPIIALISLVVRLSLPLPLAQGTQDLKHQLEAARAALAAFNWQAGPAPSSSYPTTTTTGGGFGGGGYLGLSEPLDPPGFGR